MTNRAIIEIGNIQLGSAIKTSSRDNVRSAKCINHKPTSAKLRCSLSSNLIHLKSVSDFTLSFAGINFAGISSEIKTNLNTDYLLTQPNDSMGKLLHLDYKGTWYLNENTIDSNSFESNKVPNNNMLDAIIPPSSCFDMKMTETLEKYQISFTALAKVAVYSEAGDRYVGTQLSSIATNIRNNAGIFDNKQITLDVSGHIDVNVIGSDHSEITPCIAG